jgi:hypothetical protein
MLTQKENDFIIHWQQVRERESTFAHKFMAGLPMAILFGLPVLFFLGGVKIFFPSWFTTATHKANDIVVPGMTEKFMKLSYGDVVMAFIAVLITILFFSFFRMHYKWETNEQLYNELKSKEKNGNFAATK